MKDKKLNASRAITPLVKRKEHYIFLFITIFIGYGLILAVSL